MRRFTSQAQPAQITDRIFRTSFGMALIAVSTIAIVCFWMATQMNALANSRAEQQLRTVFEIEQDRLALHTIDNAHWPVAFDLFFEGDLDALYDNLGVSAVEDSTWDFLYLLNPDRSPRYVYVSEVEDNDLSNYRDGFISELVAPLAGQPLEPYLPNSTLAAIDGQLAVVSAGRIQPYDVETLVESDLPLMINGIFLDDDRMAQLGRQTLITDIAIDLHGQTETAGRSSVTFGSIGDSPLVTISWASLTPGFQMLRHLSGVLSIFLAAMLLGSWIVARNASIQTRHYLREHQNARTDELTGLLNRAGLIEVVGSDTVVRMIAAGEAALIYIDLDDFKILNDDFGHDAGDLALVATARRLQRAVRDTDHVARIGGDEFVCLLLGHDAAGAVIPMAARIESLSSATFTHAGKTHGLSVTVGTAVAKPRDTWPDLLGAADAAMLDRKRLQNTGR